MALGTIARLYYRQAFGRRRLIFIAGFLMLPLLLCLAIVLMTRGMPPEQTPDPVLVFEFMLYPQIICGLLALLGGSFFVSTELDGRTLTYLFTRPIPKWRILIEKYIVQIAVTVPMILTSFTLSHLLLGFRGGLRVYVTFVACIIASSAAYNAVFALWGTLVPKRAMVVALIYAGFVEVWLSLVPVVLNQMTVSYYLRSLAISGTGMHVNSDAGQILGSTSLATSLLGLVLIIVIALGGAAMLLRHREFAMAEQA